ncbi:MAG TPA: FkbM family methyltransferase [Thermoanaerobaculia bacterium]|nr:FkbM family methyltransferase [Thermoanaerobaculia bacterium]
MNLRALLRKFDKKRRDRKKRPEMEAFEAAVGRLEPGDVAIDCGANVGLFTTFMAKTGATVYAFEPNPVAFEALVVNTAHYPNVKAIRAAVTAVPGPVRLYLHKWSDDDPLHWSTGSSLIAGKSNVSKEKFATVEGIPLAPFIRDVGGRVRILKMDVEGAEVAILNHLLDEGLHTAIGQAFVEVHDRKVRELVEPTRLLRERLARMGATQFRLDWR